MKTIFIQENDEELLYILTAVLTEANYKVYSFENCSKMFFSKISIYSPDLILLDYNLNELDCIAALKQIKTSYIDIPVIAFSTNYDVEDRYLQLRFDDYLIKPFELDTLYSTLTRNLGEINI